MLNSEKVMLNKIKVSYGLLAALVFLFALGTPIAFFLSFAILYLSVLIHEFGHAYIGKKLGLEIDTITLDIIGGRVDFKQPQLMYSNVKTLFYTVVAGPAANLLISCGFLPINYIFHYYNIDTYYISFVIEINFLLALTNLVPVFPLDGHKILEAYHILIGEKDYHLVSVIRGGLITCFLYILCMPYMDAFMKIVYIILLFISIVKASTEIYARRQISKIHNTSL